MLVCVWYVYTRASVCMCVCVVCICACVCLCVCAFKSTLVRTHTCTYIHMHSYYKSHICTLQLYMHVMHTAINNRSHTQELTNTHSRYNIPSVTIDNHILILIRTSWKISLHWYQPHTGTKYLTTCQLATTARIQVMIGHTKTMRE